MVTKCWRSLIRKSLQSGTVTECDRNCFTLAQFCRYVTNRASKKPTGKNLFHSVEGIKKQIVWFTFTDLPISNKTDLVNLHKTVRQTGQLNWLSVQGRIDTWKCLTKFTRSEINLTLVWAHRHRYAHKVLQSAYLCSGRGYW